MTSSTFSNSDGWNWKNPKLNHSRTPLPLPASLPKSRVAATRMMPPIANVYL